MAKNGSRHARQRLLLATVAVALATGVAGCATDRTTTGSISPAVATPSFDQMNADQLAQAADRYGKAYERNPKDKATAMAFATLLRMNGRNDQGLAVMRSLAIAYPKDRQVLAAYGKALASAGQFDAALDAVRRAQTPDYPDWRLMSAEGAILDQLGKSDDARALYDKALVLKPNEGSILSNYGMSYLLTGDLKKAETYLRRAVKANDADSRVRQNLALVLGLEGQFDEAEKIASQELSPDQARANITYLRKMLSQQNAWSMLKDKGKGKQHATN